MDCSHENLSREDMITIFGNIRDEGNYEYSEYFQEDYEGTGEIRIEVYTLKLEEGTEFHLTINHHPSDDHHFFHISKLLPDGVRISYYFEKTFLYIGNGIPIADVNVEGDYITFSVAPSHEREVLNSGFFSGMKKIDPDSEEEDRYYSYYDYQDSIPFRLDEYTFEPCVHQYFERNFFVEKI